MVRFVSLALTFFFIASVSASVLRPVARQFGDVEDAVGRFNLILSASSRGCPNNIEHLSISDPLPHSEITMNGNPCNDSSGFEMDVLDDAGVASDAVTSTDAKDTIQDINDDIVDQNITETLIFAIERNGRSCGTRNIDQLEENSLIIILRTTNDIDTANFGLIRNDFRYMWILYGETQQCRYQARLRPSPTPTNSADPSISPSIDPAASPVVPPPASTGPSPSLAASPTTPAPTPSVTASQADSSPAASVSTSGGSGGEEEVTGTPDGSEADPTEEPDDGVCFPADATVELENGDIKQMDKVQIGDRVKVGPNTYSDVFMFSHKTASVKNVFITLQTESGETMSATPGHYIYLNNRLTAIGSSQVGDVVTRANGEATRITQVTREVKTGLYNPQTVQGDIIVNGIQASSFTQHVEMCTAQAMMMPLRMMYKAFGLSLTALNNGANSIVSYLPKGNVVA